MNAEIIEHVSDYVKIIEHLADGYHNSPGFIYRGQGKESYNLIPSVFRQYEIGTYGEADYFRTDVYENERAIIQEFMTEAANFIQSIPIEDRFSWVEYGQHFGIPTRLLDWTTNPLVALFFACTSSPNDNARVFILCESAYRRITNQEEDEEFLKHTVKEHAVNMIWGKPGGFSHPIVIRPYYLDKRMSAQSSCFMVWGNEKSPLEVIIEKLEGKEKAGLLYDETVGNGVTSTCIKPTDSLSFVTIPSENKLLILHELDRLGINQATLFPGLDGFNLRIVNQGASEISMMFGVSESYCSYAVRVLYKELFRY